MAEMNDNHLSFVHRGLVFEWSQDQFHSGNLEDLEGMQPVRAIRVSPWGLYWTATVNTPWEGYTATSESPQLAVDVALEALRAYLRTSFENVDKILGG